MLIRKQQYPDKSLFPRRAMGLGLAVVWNIAHEHQGTVTAESEGQGAIFTVYLPASSMPAAIKVLRLDAASDSTLVRLKVH